MGGRFSVMKSTGSLCAERGRMKKSAQHINVQNILKRNRSCITCPIVSMLNDDLMC
jgi:hypothetical protein